jgi:hypothetical protein
MGNSGVALGESSGFVDDEEFYFGEFFERGWVSDKDAQAGGAGESASGGDGGGESESAGASGDEDSDGPVDCGSGCFSDEDPSDSGREGEKEDERSEDAGDFIGEALEGWGILFGFIDKTSESGDEGFVAGFFGKDEESAARDKGSTEDGVTDKFFNGQGFACENRFFDGGVAFENFSVCGDRFSWQDDELVAGLNFGPGDNFFRTVGEESGGGRGER